MVLKKNGDVLSIRNIDEIIAFLFTLIILCFGPLNCYAVILNDNKNKKSQIKMTKNPE